MSERRPSPTERQGDSDALHERVRALETELATLRKGRRRRVSKIGELSIRLLLGKRLPEAIETAWDAWVRHLAVSPGERPSSWPSDETRDLTVAAVQRMTRLLTLGSVIAIFPALLFALQTCAMFQQRADSDRANNIAAFTIATEVRDLLVGPVSDVEGKPVLDLGAVAYCCTLHRWDLPRPSIISTVADFSSSEAAMERALDILVTDDDPSVSGAATLASLVASGHAATPQSDDFTVSGTSLTARPVEASRLNNLNMTGWRMRNVELQGIHGLLADWHLMQLDNVSLDGYLASMGMSSVRMHGGSISGDLSESVVYNSVFTDVDFSEVNAGMTVVMGSRLTRVHLPEMSDYPMFVFGSVISDIQNPASLAAVCAWDTQLGTTQYRRPANCTEWFSLNVYMREVPDGSLDIAPWQLELPVIHEFVRRFKDSALWEVSVYVPGHLQGPANDLLERLWPPPIMPSWEVTYIPWAGGGMQIAVRVRLPT